MQSEDASVPVSSSLLKLKGTLKKLTSAGLAVGLLFSSSVAYAIGTIKQVRVGQDVQKTRIVFDLQDKAKFQIRMLNNPSRVMVVFNHVDNNISFNEKTFNDSRLYKMQVSDKGNQTQVTMQLHKTLDISSFHLGENAHGFNRLVIDLKDAAENSPKPKIVPAKKEVKAQPQLAAKHTPETTAEIAQPATKEVTQSSVITSVEAKQKEVQTPAVVAEPEIQSEEKPQDAIDKSVDILLGTKLPEKVVAEEAEGKALVTKAGEKAITEKTEPLEAAQTKIAQKSELVVADKPEQTKQTSAKAAKAENQEHEVAKAELKASVQKIVKPPVGNGLELVVALDAGHGGKDPGAVNRQTRIMEKDVTLQMAKQLKRQIDAQPNMRAVLIREKDVFIPLYERQKIAKSKGADIFISIHADAFEDERVHGGSVYVLSRRGASSHMARLLAKSENAYLQDVKLSGFDDDVAYALSDLSRRSNIDHSQKLAKSVLFEMDKKLTMHRAHVQSAQFAVLKAIDMPSMLIETAFISNPKEARNLVNPLFQKKMANAIVSGLNHYIETHRQAPVQAPNTLFVRYEVKSGDNLTTIAKKFNVTVAKIKHHNGIRNANRLYVGKSLRIPVSQDLLAKIDQIS
nr:N-acetylmuramoyl-L-alanine amidase [Thiomicrorhabdus marina]